jgi:hypothetical protein
MQSFDLPCNQHTQPVGRSWRVNSKPATGSMLCFCPQARPGKVSLGLPRHLTLLAQFPQVELLWGACPNLLPLLDHLSWHSHSMLPDSVTGAQVLGSGPKLPKCSLFLFFRLPEYLSLKTKGSLSRCLGFALQDKGSDRMSLFVQASFPYWTSNCLTNPCSGLKAYTKFGLIL